MKDVKKLLRQQSRDVLPDNDVKDRIRSELGFAPETERRAATAHGGSVHVGRPTIAVFVAAALVVVLALAVIIPFALDGGAGSPVIPDSPVIMSTQGDFYAYSALAVGSLLSRTDALDGTSASRLALAGPGNGVQSQIRDVAEEYIRLVESLLAEDDITHSPVSVPEQYSSYAYAMTVTGYGIGDGVLTYTLYYNEALSSQQHDGEESERNYDIEGILSTPGGDFEVRGGRESEQESDGDENENEEELWFVAYTGENSYIRIDQEAELETEDGETESERTHRVTVVQNGVVTEDTTIELEQEEGETEVALSIRRDGRTDTLEFTRRNVNGTDIIYARARFAAGNASFRVHCEQGGYRFEFDDFYDEDDD